MPEYLVRVKTDVILDREGLDGIEDVVYDYVTHQHGGSVDIDAEGIGLTDVAADYA